MTNDLEGLLAQAVTEQSARVKQRETNLAKVGGKLNKTLTVIENRLAAIYRNPDNWLKTRTIALIHRGEEETLLGVFNELTHKTVEGCRRLVRIEGPAEVDAKEWVEGPQWLTRAEERAAARSWHESRECILDLHIPSLGLSALACIVTVGINTEVGGIERVVLKENTRFSAADRHSFLFLPAGLNVLHELSVECKLTIKAECGL